VALARLLPRPLEASQEDTEYKVQEERWRRPLIQLVA
jgi:hypothetical protein